MTAAPKNNPWERGKSDFQSYHIIILKYPVSNTKEQGKKERGKYRPLKEKRFD